MIITRLCGGLGNQMFQYAAARRLAEKHRTELKLDLSFFSMELDKDTTPRAYALDIFKTIQTAATPWERFKLYPHSKNRHKNMVLTRLIRFGLIKDRRYAEKHCNFDPAVLHLTGRTMLDGYFQSEKYFKDIEEIIRREFTLKSPLSAKAAAIQKQIKETESVSLHVRRGDYITNKAAGQFHGMCYADYYQRAIAIIKEKIKHPHFYIFSDDPKWVKENIHIPNPHTYIADHTDKDYEELILMAHCKHNIIANSSFSWWGAWLNNPPHKIVIAPTRWFTDEKIDTSDLIPKSWTRI